MNGALLGIDAIRDIQRLMDASRGPGCAEASASGIAELLGYDVEAGLDELPPEAETTREVWS